jgi:hypothetical protein
MSVDIVVEVTHESGQSTVYSFGNKDDGLAFFSGICIMLRTFLFDDTNEIRQDCISFRKDQKSLFAGIDQNQLKSLKLIKSLGLVEEDQYTDWSGYYLCRAGRDGEVITKTSNNNPIDFTDEPFLME